MKLKTVKRVYYMLLILCIIVSIVGYHFLDLIVYIMAGGIPLAAMGVLLHKYWRCPVCGTQLGKMKVDSIITCPQCGEKVNIDD